MKAKTDATVPAALREVRERKETVFRETERMTIREALLFIHREVEGIRNGLALKVIGPTTRVAQVAEEPAAYQPAKKA